MTPVKSFLMAALVCAALPAMGQNFQPFVNFPGPAPNAFGVTGAALPDGRLLLWDGEVIYTQLRPGADQFTARGGGYAGDPGFAAISPNGQRILLGAGFGGDLFLFPSNALGAFTAEKLVATRSHFSGDFLNEQLAILDAGKPDFSGSELVIVELDGAKAAPRAVVTKSAKYHEAPKTQVVDKPPFSFSGGVHVDHATGRVFSMDTNTRELRFFSRDALLAAYTAETTLDWETDGVLIGAPGQFFSGGVSGVTPEGHLVIGGSEGFLMPGGIHIVDPNFADPSQASIVETLDPAGNEPFYGVIYDDVNDVIIALQDGGPVWAPAAYFVALPAIGLAGLGLLCTGILLAAARRRRAGVRV